MRKSSKKLTVCGKNLKLPKKQTKCKQLYVGIAVWLVEGHGCLELRTAEVQNEVLIFEFQYCKSCEQ